MQSDQIQRGAIVVAGDSEARLGHWGSDEWIGLFASRQSDHQAAVVRLRCSRKNEIRLHVQDWTRSLFRLAVRQEKFNPDGLQVMPSTRYLK